VLLKEKQRMVEVEHIRHGFAEEEAKGPVDDVL
jgi:hypothetical protein